MTAGALGSTLGMGFREISSSAVCSSLAGGDGGGGPTLFEVCPGRSGLGAGPDATGADRSDRLTL